MAETNNIGCSISKNASLYEIKVKTKKSPT